MLLKQDLLCLYCVGVSGMDNVSHVESPCLSRFGHDLIHIFTILILNPHCDRKARNKLIAAAKKFNV